MRWCPGPENPQKEQDNDRTIVVQITHRPGGGVPGYKINELDISHGDLLNKLEGIFATRAEKVMFVKGDPKWTCRRGGRTRTGHEAGVDHIGLITPKVAAGQSNSCAVAGWATVSQMLRISMTALKERLPDPAA